MQNFQKVYYVKMKLVLEENFLRLTVAVRFQKMSTSKFFSQL